MNMEDDFYQKRKFQKTEESQRAVPAPEKKKEEKEEAKSPTLSEIDRQEEEKRKSAKAGDAQTFNAALEAIKRMKGKFDRRLEVRSIVGTLFLI